MQFFGSKDTVDGKARSILGDLPEDPSPFEILQTVDQKAGDAVDPDDVVATMRELDGDVDAKLGSVEGDDVDQKDLRRAAGAIADRTNMSQAGAMELLSGVIDSIESMDPAEFSDEFSDVVEEHLDDDADVDQNAQNDPGGTGDATETPTETHMGTNPTPDDTEPDQKQETEGGDDNGDGNDDGGPLDMLNDDARETVEEFAKLSGKDPEECVQEVLGDGGSGGSDSSSGDQPEDTAPPADQASAAPDQAQNTPTEQMGYDQKSGDGGADLNERIAAAVTSDEVLDEMAGAVAQKMAIDDEFADSLVETVDKKGDFVTTDDSVITAPSDDSTTVSEAGVLTGGNGGDGE